MCTFPTPAAISSICGERELFCTDAEISVRQQNAAAKRLARLTAYVAREYSLACCDKVCVPSTACDPLHNPQVCAQDRVLRKNIQLRYETINFDGCIVCCLDGSSTVARINFLSEPALCVHVCMQILASNHTVGAYDQPVRMTLLRC
jgi:hypothetical protein